MEIIGRIILGIAWIWGMVLANGFWSTLFAVFLPPWGWYLCAVEIFTHYNP